MQEDNDLIRAFKKGDSEAFRILYRKHEKGAFFYALSLTGDENAAEEALQEAFMAFVKTAPDYRPKGSFRSYLMTAVRSKVIDAYRKMEKKHLPLDGAAPDLFESPEESAGTRELTEKVSRVIFELPDDQREVVAMKIYNDMTFREIARVIGESHNTAASRYRYACDKLKTKLSEYMRNE